MNQNAESIRSDGSEEKSQTELFEQLKAEKNENRVSNDAKADITRYNVRYQTMPLKANSRKRIKIDNSDSISKEHIEAACAEGYARYFLPLETDLLEQSDVQQNEYQQLKSYEKQRNEDSNRAHPHQDFIPVMVSSTLLPSFSDQRSQAFLMDNNCSLQDHDSNEPSSAGTMYQYSSTMDTRVALSQMTRSLNNTKDQMHHSQSHYVLPNTQSSTSNEEMKRFKQYHENKWNEQFDELRKFKSVHGHCLVPHTFDENPHLARWVKRQRRQYKLMQEGNPASTMTSERVDVLNKEGFVWDFHEIVWLEKFNQLREFVRTNGHFKISNKSTELRQLTSWIKCQRRQYKLFKEGKQSSLSQERMTMLNSIGFNWEVRSSAEGKVKTSP